MESKYCFLLTLLDFYVQEDTYRSNECSLFLIGAFSFQLSGGSSF